MIPLETWEVKVLTPVSVPVGMKLRLVTPSIAHDGRHYQ